MTDIEYMEPTTLNLTIYQGATYRKTINWSAGDPTALPVNLTGCTLRMQIRESMSASAAILTLTNSNGGIIVDADPTTGSFELFISATNTAGITVSQAVYDLEVVFTDGDVVRLLQGKVTISKEVTR
jgi:hypothetical protein